MSKQTNDVQNEPKSNDSEVAELSKSLVKKENRISDLEQRLSRIEKRTKSNERFARTFAACVSTQVLANEAIAEALRRSLHNDAEVQNELMLAIREYDQHKCRRWINGFLGVLLRITALAVAAFMGAFIYWAFSGQ